MLPLSDFKQLPGWKVAVPTQKINAVLVHRNLLIISEGLTLQTFDIRLRERTSQITTTKKCTSLFIDDSVNQLYAGCNDTLLIFMVSYDRVTFLS